MGGFGEPTISHESGGNGGLGEPTLRADDIGQCHEFQISGRPVFDATGKFTGYRGTGSVTRIETKAPMAGPGLQQSGSG